jgi:Domain of unknown function (DUF4288)
VTRNWYSSMVTFVTDVQGDSAAGYTRSVVLIRGTDFDDALSRVLEVGHQLESSYRNSVGRAVKHSLVRIDTLDCLGDKIDDGREVYAEMGELGDQASVVENWPPSPELSRPTQSGV